MPNGDTRRRVLNYESQIAALAILRFKKSQLALKAAPWMSHYQAQLELAHQERRIAEINQAIRDVIVVAVTGVFACIGSCVVTSLLARSAGVAYRSGSLAAPLVASSATATLPTGSVIAINGLAPLGLTATQWIASQVIQTIVIRVPVGAFLTRVVGSSALGRLFDLLKGTLDPVVYSDAEFQALRRILAAQGVGNERFQRIIRDPGARREQLLPAVAEALREMVAQHFGEAIMGLPEPINGLMLMNEAELARWYDVFRAEVDSYLARQYARMSIEDRSILRNTLHWDFWLHVQNQLHAADMKWHGDTRTLHRAINGEILSMEALAPRSNR